jgi:LacI family transcriptional regulator
MATLKDVARRVGLSVTQVSRALNDHADVSADTKIRVADAAKALKYHPNVSARKLASGRSGMVALVVASYPGLTQDHMFFEVAAGLSAQFSSQAMQFVLHIAKAGENQIAVYQRLIGSGTLDGFVLTATESNDQRIRYLKSRGVPFVVHGRAEGDDDYPYFDIDNFGLAAQATRHLTARGHQRIALINGLQGMSFAKARLDGYRTALSEADLSLSPDLVAHGWMDESLGLVETVRMFSGSRPPPTAIFCSNVLIAKGVYAGLSALGKAVPQAVSVIAHDDLLPDVRASAFYPPLTVTRSPLRESWVPLTEFLAGAIEGRPIGSLQRIAPHEFIERGSVAVAPE